MTETVKYTAKQWLASEARDVDGNVLVIDEDGLVATVGSVDDARLIAAAPEMLEALKKARGLIDATAFNLHTSLSHNGKRNARPYFDAVAEIDALIAKAEGRS